MKRDGGREHMACLQRQLGELDALDAMYPDSLQVDGDVALWRSCLDRATEERDSSGAPRDPPVDLPAVSGTLSLPGPPEGLSLAFTLPRDYPGPDSAPPRVRATCVSLPSKSAHATLAAAAAEAIDECGPDVECLVAVAEAVLSAARALPAEDVAGHYGTSNSTPPRASSGSPQLGRRVIWFHHIKSPTKKKLIKDWGRELGLSGVMKPGYPGVLLLEGREDDVAEMVRRLRSLTWKAMQVRCEETEDVPGQQGGSVDVSGLRKLPGPPLVALGEDGMSELSAICTEGQLQEMFLSAMKLDAASAGRGGR
ncbi:unnamed protein product [Pedinophyceae sp. YPF-701]|nr:unnamed protein product [Pedinophyceae sp. YPF-701]